MSDLWDQEDQLRRGDEYNKRLKEMLRWCDVLDDDIDRLMSPLDKGVKNEGD